MAKYYNYKGTPVICATSSGKKHNKFIADNEHLVGSECDKAEYDELLAEQAVNEVKQQRRAEYPAIADQLDAIMKWLATETEFGVPAELKSIAMKCMSVKAKYPLP